MSIGLLTSTIQVLKKVREQADPVAQSLANGITALIKPGTDYSYLANKKSRLQLIRLSAVVCGIELCYAAETAFVTPILLKLGVPMSFMTLVWCVSPLLGFFLVPVLGSMSDSCRSHFGRRRPFIAVLSIGIVLGLVLVPNGESFGLLMGDKGTVVIKNITVDINDNHTVYNDSSPHTNHSFPTPDMYSIVSLKLPKHHVAGIVLTIFGVAILDFSCDAAQSPSRAYLLDISVADDHSAGLTTFTVMAGIGGSLGYAMGGINWNVKSFGESLGGHIRVVFSIVLFIFIFCVFITITSFKEVPLDEVGFTEEQMQKRKKKKGKSKYTKFTNEETDSDFEEEVKNKALKKSCSKISSYGTLSKESALPTINVSHEEDEDKPNTPEEQNAHVKQNETKNENKEGEKREVLAITLLTEIKFKTYIMSIVKMPRSLIVLCLTNLFSWMSLVCFSLYFTDFVGQAVYGGDPKSPLGSMKHKLYDEGVRLGSFGMSLYSLSCAVYSLCIEKLISTFKAKKVYIVGQLVYTIGMVILACIQSPVATLLLSPSAGIMYATLFTMPYLLVAHYHTRTEFTKDFTQEEKMANIRGLGTDIALVSSMVFLAQFLLSAFVGTIVDAVNSTVAVIVAAAILSFCGAITATQVTYYDI